MKKSKIIVGLFALVLVACGEQQVPENMRSLATGYEMYSKHCENCHGAEGEGLARLIPPLKNSDFLKKYPDSIAGIIRHGQKGVITVNGIQYNLAMPGNTVLTDDELSQLLNYVQTRFVSNQDK
ncbi:MAG: c-type cytochrome [Bacteroidia bacterium]